MISFGLDLEKYVKAINQVKLTKDIGKTTQVKGNLIKGFVPEARLGSICEIHLAGGQRTFLAEVVGFENRSVLMMPLGDMHGVGLGAKIVLLKTMATASVGHSLLGRVIDGLGQPIDGKGDLFSFDEVPLYQEASNPMERETINEPLSVGIRSIDGVTTFGKGQRVGIMAGSGVGKSVLLGMIAKNTDADISVIALIGERGREVKEFIEHNLGQEGLKKSVIIAVTSDQSPLIRMRGAYLATAISEFFCHEGADVMLMMDSVTRFAMAQREIGLSVGEPPATKGYTPSVFSALPKLLERAGNFTNAGSITGLYSVLVEGDDMDDPIADAVRSVVDGHIVLSRNLAQRGHFPAVDILQSTSRVMRNVVDSHHVDLASIVRENIAYYRDAEDLINIGAYKSGANSKIDRAVQLHEGLESFLRQGADDESNLESAVQYLSQVVGV